jgi:uncharacterized membrane protein
MNNKAGDGDGTKVDQVPPTSEQRLGMRQVEIRSVSWQGPIPPPSTIREYNEIIENGAERIFAQFEKETEHRHKLESRQQLLPFIDQLVARATALVFALACLGAGIFSVIHGAYWVAAFFGAAMITHGVNAFLRTGQFAPAVLHCHALQSQKGARNR